MRVNSNVHGLNELILMRNNCNGNVVYLYGLMKELRGERTLLYGIGWENF